MQRAIRLPRRLHEADRREIPQEPDKQSCESGYAGLRRKLRHGLPEDRQCFLRYDRQDGFQTTRRKSTRKIGRTLAAHLAKFPAANRAIVFAETTAPQLAANPLPESREFFISRMNCTVYPPSCAFLTTWMEKDMRCDPA